MRTVMIFQSQKALAFLLKRGIVVTFRKDRRKNTGKSWINDGRGRPKIADATVTEMNWQPTNPLDLAGNVSYSGFSSLREWLDEIRRLNNGTLPKEGWLYFVELEKGSVKIPVGRARITVTEGDEEDARTLAEIYENLSYDVEITVQKKKVL